MYFLFTLQPYGFCWSVRDLYFFVSTSSALGILAVANSPSFKWALEILTQVLIFQTKYFTHGGCYLPKSAFVTEVKVLGGAIGKPGEVELQNYEGALHSEQP